MNLFLAALAFALALLLALAGVTRVGVWVIERRFPPAGAFATIEGMRVHYVHVPAAHPDLPPVVFLHGASANLNDPMVPLRGRLEGRADLLFLDRPGHGWSGRGRNHDTPRDQARVAAALMSRLGIERAVIVGHSFGGAATAVFGVEMPERVAGLVFLSAVSHPWPGRATAWYYKLTAAPVIGPLFAQTLALPAGLGRIRAAAACVFSPNRMPDDYLTRAAIPLVLRPTAFRANALDVEGLYSFVAQEAPRYPEITAPTVVISGDRDTVVYEEVHSLGLARDIPGAELVWVRNMGHKPDWVAPDLVAAAIEQVAGKPRDLQELARAVEARLGGDRFGVDGCPPEDAPSGELAPQ